MKKVIKIISLIIMVFSIILTAQDNSDIFALIRANNTQEIRKLISQDGFNVNIQDLNGNTPLIHAVMRRNQQLVQALIEAKANVNIKNGEGNTALTYERRGRKHSFNIRLH